MGQGAARNDERVDFFISDPGFAQSINSSGWESLLDQLHEILIGTQTLHAKDGLNPFEHTEVFERRSVGHGCLCYTICLDGTIAHDLRASCPLVSKVPRWIYGLHDGLLHDRRCTTNGAEEVERTYRDSLSYAIRARESDEVG